MTVELLVSLAAGLLSLAVAYIPGVKEKYDQLDTQGKARVMAIALIVVTLGVFGLACANLLALFGLDDIACTPASLVQLVQLLVIALVTNQAVFSIAVRPFRHTSDAGS